MSDIYVVLPSAPGERKAVSQSEQMLSSTCYQKSGGRMGCISCHNPHTLPVGDVAVAFDQKCSACHSTDQSTCSEALAERTGKSCIGCHMPRFDAKDIPHTALTDHRILKRPQQNQTQDSEEQVFDEGEPALPNWEVLRARALNVRSDRKQVRGPEDLERAAATLRGMTDRLEEDPDVWESLAWFDTALGKWTEVEKSATKALELSPKRLDSRELLVGALSARAAWSDVDRECSLLLKMDPNKGLYYKLLAESAWHQGDLEPGLKLAEKSFDYEPTQMELRHKLSIVYEQLGETERAEKHRRVLKGLSRFLK